jgi:hypothetical protein
MDFNLLKFYKVGGSLLSLILIIDYKFIFFFSSNDDKKHNRDGLLSLNSKIDEISQKVN